MKRGPKTSLSNRVEKMSIKGLIVTILVLVALISLLVLIGQTIDEGEVGIGWIVRFGAVLL